MKTKLTLTVHKKTIANAKRAAELLLAQLKSSNAIKTLDDKQSMRAHVARKLA